jgi:hypothetical protein
MTQNVSECRRCLAVRHYEVSDNIAAILTDSVVGEGEEHLRLRTKSHNKAWSLAYTASSISEPCSGRSQSLAEFREIPIQIEEQAEVNRRYLKSLKRRKAENS